MATEPTNSLDSTSSATAARSVVNCRIESSNQWLRWSRAALWDEVRTALERSIAPWRDALQLPVDVRFAWHADRDTDWPGDTICRLLFDDRDSQFVRLPEEKSAKAEEVAAALAKGIFEARASLVTPEVVRRLRPENDVLTDGEADRLELARELVRRGLGPKRAWSAEPGLSPSPSKLPYDTIVDQEAIALQVKVRSLASLNAQHDVPDSLDKLFELMSDGMFDELGLMLPPIQLEEDANLPPATIAIWINDLPLPLEAGLAEDEILINEGPDRLGLSDVDGLRASANPAHGTAASILAATEDNLRRVKRMGLTSWGAAGHLVLVVSAAVHRYAGALWTIDSTRAVLFLLRDTIEPLIQATDSRFDRGLLTLVLRRLLDEEVTVRQMLPILESMLAIDSVSNVDDGKLIPFPPAAGNIAISRRAASVANLQVNDWVACVRTRLARYLSHKYTRGQATLAVYLLDPDIEAQLEAAAGIAHEDSAAVELSTPAGYLRLFRAVEAEISAHDSRAVILTTQSVRSRLRELIARDLPNVTVLSYQELSPELNIQPVARISWL